MAEPAHACVFVGLWALTPEAQAAWVQAIGSIGAVLAAVFISWRQNRNRDRLDERQTERQGLAVALDIRRDLEKWRESLDVGFTPSLQERGNGYVVGKYAETLKQNRAADVPENLNHNVFQIYTLGNAGSVLLRAMFAARELEATIERVWQLKSSPLGDNHLTDAANELIELVKVQHDRLAEVLTNVVGRFD